MVDRPLEPGEQASPPSLAFGQLVEQLDGHPEVVEEVLEGGVDDVEVGAGQGELRRAMGLGHEQGPRVGPEGGRRVGRRLDVALDLLAAHRGAGEPVMTVVGRQPLDGDAAR